MPQLGVPRTASPVEATRAKQVLVTYSPGVPPPAATVVTYSPGIVTPAAPVVASPQPIFISAAAPRATGAMRRISSPPVPGMQYLQQEVVRRESCPSEPMMRHDSRPPPQVPRLCVTEASQMAGGVVSACDAGFAENFDIFTPAATGEGRVQPPGRDRHTLVKSMVEIVDGVRTRAHGRIYLYQAPFTPSVRYKDGIERFVLPAGWAVLRSRHGLLMWVELLDDLSLREVALELVGATTLDGSAALGAGAPPPTPATGGGRMLGLRLPGAVGGLFGQVDLQVPRACAVDAPICVPCEDVMVLHPSGSVGEGLRGRLTVASSGPESVSLDDIFKSWLSAWDAQI